MAAKKTTAQGYHELMLPPIAVTSSGRCISMDVLHLQGQLQLLASDIQGRTSGKFSNIDELVWHQAGPLGPVWNRVSVYLQSTENITVQPLLHNKYNRNLKSGQISVSIDNVLMTDGTCQNEKCVLCID